MTEEKLSLSQVSSKSGSDKHVHGFTDFYETYIQGLEPQVVCEIGMGGLIPSHWPMYQHIEQDNPGGSSRMWLKYFPNAKVVHTKRNLKDTALSIYKNVFDAKFTPTKPTTTFM